MSTELIEREPHRDASIDQSFPSSSRLLRRSEFQKVQERGLRSAGTALILFACPNSLGRCRLGLTVSKRVGNAVCRAQVKRRLRDIFRKERFHLPASMDLVAIAKPAAKDADRKALLKEFLRATAYFQKRMALTATKNDGSKTSTITPFDSKMASGGDGSSAQATTGASNAQI